MASTSATARKAPKGQLLSGLVRCAGCRYRMSKGKGPQGEDMYRRRGRHASGTCPETAAILTETLDDYVEKVILAELDTAATLVPDTANRDEALAALEAAQAELEDFRQDTAARKKLGAAWHEWLDVYLHNVKEAEIALGRINELAGVAGSEGLARDHYLALPTDERREVLGASSMLSSCAVLVARAATSTRPPIAPASSGAAKPPPTCRASGSSTTFGLSTSGKATSKPGLRRRRQRRSAAKPSRRAWPDIGPTTLLWSGLIATPPCRSG
jgi:hypothetical protein